MSSITFEDSYLGQSAVPIVFVPAEDSPVVLTEVVQVTPFLLVPNGRFPNPVLSPAYSLANAERKSQVSAFIMFNIGLNIGLRPNAAVHH